MKKDLEHILRRCKAGDSKAQHALYDIYKARLMGLCRRYASSREEAQDILQEVFLKIFRQIDTLKKLESLESWMSRITVYTAITYYHKHKNYNYNTTSTEQIIETENDKQVSEDIISKISNDELLRIINELPDGYRIIINLYIIDGYNHSEIGELLGISEGTSKSQLSRAKKLLQKKLQEVGFQISEYGKAI